MVASKAKLLRTSFKQRKDGISDPLILKSRLIIASLLFAFFIWKTSCAKNVSHRQMQLSGTSVLSKRTRNGTANSTWAPLYQRLKKGFNDTTADWILKIFRLGSTASTYQNNQWIFANLSSNVLFIYLEINFPEKNLLIFHVIRSLTHEHRTV